MIDARLDEIMATEGGYVDHPSDRGGPTNHGITARRLGEWRGLRRPATASEVRGLGRDEARAILRADYVERPGFDAVARVSALIGWEVVDSGVNFGPVVPSVWLQQWLSALNRRGRDYPDVAPDGVVGPRTVAALERYLAVRGAVGERVLFMGLNCSQGARYLELARSREANQDFLYGWVRTRVLEQVQR